MSRIVSTLLVAGALVLAGSPAPTLLWSPVAYAEPSDKEVMDQLLRIKSMVADMEMKMKSGSMAMDAMGKEKTMKMLADVEKMLKDLQMRQAP